MFYWYSRIAGAEPQLATVSEIKSEWSLKDITNAIHYIRAREAKKAYDHKKQQRETKRRQRKMR